MPIKILTTCLLLLKITLCQAQQSVTRIHFDQSRYLAGEHIFFSFSNTQLPTDSLTVEISISNGDQSFWDHFFVVAREKQAHGYYKTMYDQPPGKYRLEGYIYAGSSAERTQLFAVEVPIFAADARPTDTIMAPSLKHQTILDANLILKDPLPSEIRNRTSVTLQVDEQKLPKNIVQLSASVRRKMIGQFDRTSMETSAVLKAGTFSSKIALPGVRSFVGEEPPLTEPILFGCDAEVINFVRAHVTDEGRFHMELPKFYGWRKIQFVDYQLHPVNITHQLPALSIDPRPVGHGAIPIVQSTDHHRVRNKIHHLFRTTSKSVLKDTISPVRKPAPDFFLDVSDLAIKGALFNVFKEVLTPLKFIKMNGGKFSAVVFYTYGDQKIIHGRKTLFMLNGHLLDDAEYVANLPIQEVKHVNIYTEEQTIRRLIGAVGHCGIIDIEMMDPFFVPPSGITAPFLNQRGLQHPLIYPVVPSQRDHMPNINPQLYWNPNLASDGNQAYRIEFNTTDDLGIYLVEILVVDAQGAAKKYRADFTMLMN